MPRDSDPTSQPVLARRIARRPDRLPRDAGWIALWSLVGGTLPAFVLITICGWRARSSGMRLAWTALFSAGCVVGAAFFIRSSIHDEAGHVTGSLIALALFIERIIALVPLLFTIVILGSQFRIYRFFRGQWESGFAGLNLIAAAFSILWLIALWWFST